MKADRLRVLLLIPHLGGGGAEQVTALLARGLSDRKYEIPVSYTHLDVYKRQALAPGRQHHHVHSPIKRQRIGYVTGSMDVGMRGDPFADAGWKFVFAVIEPAHQEQVRIRFALEYLVERLNQLRQSLVPCKPAHESHDLCLQGQSKPHAYH